MRQKIVTALFAALLLFLSAPAGAQDYKAQLQIMNATAAAQNPQYRTRQEMFAMRIVDANSRLVGRVEDIRVDESGALAGLVSRIDRVGRYDRVVENTGGEITFRADISAFQIPLAYEGEDAPRGGLSLQDLAAIAPAAGGGKILSLKAMKGAELRNFRGPYLGTVNDILFDERGESIAALVLENVPGASRYDNIAVPYDERITVLSDYGRIEFRLDPESAQSLSEFARSRR